MKIQDIIFLIILAVLFYKINPKYFVIAGLVCFALAIPLFYLWIFFTAERLVYYGFAFILSSVLIYLLKSRQS
ncbi:hypothetical protein KJ980_07285 [Patescibacteria group bacterium]|nr:hypothetical protein [Patescibacteria group bacterium]MBU4099424.1 hypothetical protein [Patescibacteria group bacterium]